MRQLLAWLLTPFRWLVKGHLGNIGMVLVMGFALLLSGAVAWESIDKWRNKQEHLEHQYAERLVVMDKKQQKLRDTLPQLEQRLQETHDIAIIESYQQALAIVAEAAIRVPGLASVSYQLGEPKYKDFYSELPLYAVLEEATQQQLDYLIDRIHTTCDFCSGVDYVKFMVLDNGRVNAMLEIRSLLFLDNNDREQQLAAEYAAMAKQGNDLVACCRATAVAQ